jgi:hypothetical protein
VKSQREATDSNWFMDWKKKKSHLLPGSEIFLEHFPFGDLGIKDARLRLSITKKSITCEPFDYFQIVDTSVNVGNSSGRKTLESFFSGVSKRSHDREPKQVTKYCVTRTKTAQKTT